MYHVSLVDYHIHFILWSADRFFYRDTLTDDRNSTAEDSGETHKFPARVLSENFSWSMETSVIKWEREKHASRRLHPGFIEEQRKLGHKNRDRSISRLLAATLWWGLQ